MFLGRIGSAITRAISVFAPIALLAASPAMADPGAPVPAITAISPNQSEASGTAVTVTGSDFVSGDSYTLSFGGTVVPATYVDDTHLSATAPAHAAGSVSVTARDTTAGVDAIGSLSFTYLPKITISSAFPTYAFTDGLTTRGNNLVVLTGSGFTGVTKVMFGDKPALGFTVDSDTQLTAQAPPRDAGFINIVASRDSGATSNGLAFEFRTRLGINCSMGGDVHPGGSVILAYAGGLTCGVGAATYSPSYDDGYIPLAQGSIAWTSSGVVYFANADAKRGTDGFVGVSRYIGPNGSYFNVYYYVVIDRPEITSFTPSGAYPVGGVRVVLTGKYLNGTTGVTIGGVAATDIENISDTQIAFRAPAGVTGKITVTTKPSGPSFESAASFTTYANPSFTFPVNGGTAGVAPLIRGNAPGAASVALSIDGGAPVAATVSGSTFSYQAPNLGSGTHTLSVTAVDQGGGTTATATTISYSTIDAPIFSSLSANVGSTAGGKALTVNGSGFLAGHSYTMSFGGSVVTATYVNASTLSVTTPARAAGAVTVTLTDTSASLDASGSASFTYVAPATISSLTPTSGPIAGGTSVTITGTNFDASRSYSLSFGGTVATGTWVSATRLTVVTPAHALGATTVTVTDATNNLAGTGSATFTYVAPPTSKVTFSPTTVPAAGGTSTLTLTLTNPNTVSITNVTDYLNLTTVWINAIGTPSKTCSGGTIDSNVNHFGVTGSSLASGASCTVTTLVTIPGNAPTALFTLSAGAPSAGTPGAGVEGTAGTIEKLAAIPTVLSVSPNAGPIAGNASVTITGTGFLGIKATGAVKFGSSVATYTVVDDGQISATTPSGAVGPVDVTVASSGGTSTTSSADRYTYVAPPAAPVLETPANGATVVGNTPDLAGTATPGVDVDVIVDDQKVGTVQAQPGGAWFLAAPTPLAAGTHTVKATASGVGGTSSVSNTNTFTVRDPLSIATGKVNGNTVGGTYTQTNPAAGGLTPYTYSLASGTLPAGTNLDPATGTVSGTPTAVGAFRYVVRVSYDNQGRPLSIDGDPVEDVIAKGDQKIDFAGPKDTRLSSTTIDLSATASSQLAVTFTSETQAVCTVSGTTLTLVARGTCTLDADQAGDDNWNAAATAKTSFEVLPADVSLTTGKTLGAQVGATYQQDSAASGGIAPYSFTVLSGTLPAGTTLDPATGSVSGVPTTAGAFSYALQVSDSQNPAVSAKGDTVSGTIAKGDQTIKFLPPASPKLSVGTLALDASANSGLTVSFTSATSDTCAVSGTTVTLKAIGSCVVNADQTGDENWNAAQQTSARFLILPSDLVLTAGKVSEVQVGRKYRQDNAVSGGVGPYSYKLASGALPAGTTLDPVTGSVSGVPTTAGAFSYAVQVSDSQDPTITTLGDTVSDTIAKGDQGIKFPVPANPKLSAGTITIDATAKSDLTVTFTSATLDSCTVAGRTVTLKAIGSCVINADQAGDANWNAAPQASARFLILPSDLTVKSVDPTGTMMGASYSQTNSAAGGVGPYTYDVATGALPAGTTLDASTGTVSGKPTLAGSFSYAIRATDSQNPAVSATGDTVSGKIDPLPGPYQQSWVSGDGDDANPCTREQPCQTFAAAFANTIAGGQINCLTPGGFGTLTITRAVTIACKQGGVAGLMASGVTAITINAPADAAIALRGLDLNGLSGTGIAGIDGIQFLSGGSLTVTDTVIRNFAGYGIDFMPVNSAVLTVDKVSLTNNGDAAVAASGGIAVRPVGAGLTARAAISRTIVTGGPQIGIRFEANGGAGNRVLGTIDRSQVSGSGVAGLLTRGGAGTAMVGVSNSTLSGNGIGVLTNGPTSATMIFDSSISQNTTGLMVSGSGTNSSGGGNKLLSNADGNAFTTTLTPR